MNPWKDEPPLTTKEKIGVTLTVAAAFLVVAVIAGLDQVPWDRVPMDWLKQASAS